MDKFPCLYGFQYLENDIDRLELVEVIDVRFEMLT
jgi:hypothetical protein